MKLFDPSTAFRDGRPWRVEVPWLFMPVMISGVIVVAAVEGFVITRFIRRCPGLLAEAVIQLSMVTAVLLMFVPIPPRGGITDKLGMRKLSWGDLVIALLGLVLIYRLQITSMPPWVRLLELLNLQGAQQQELLTECGRSSFPKFLGMVALAGGLIPFVEEVLYRRVLFGFCRPLGVWPALIATALIFAAAHNFLYGFPALFGLGVVFQLQYLFTGNLLTSTLTHMIYNTISLTLVFCLS